MIFNIILNYNYNIMDSISSNDLILINMLISSVSILLHLFNNYKIIKIKKDVSSFLLYNTMKNFLNPTNNIRKK